MRDSPEVPELHLKQICHTHEIEARLSVLLIGIGENEFWQWNALQ